MLEIERKEGEEGKACPQLVLSPGQPTYVRYNEEFQSPKPTNTELPLADCASVGQVMRVVYVRRLSALW